VHVHAYEEEVRSCNRLPYSDQILDDATVKMSVCNDWTSWCREVSNLCCLEESCQFQEKPRLAGRESLDWCCFIPVHGVKVERQHQNRVTSRLNPHIDRDYVVRCTRHARSQHRPFSMKIRVFFQADSLCAQRRCGENVVRQRHLDWSD
jgi:hypothetical protein